MKQAEEEIGRRRAAEARELLLQQLAAQESQKRAADEMAKRRAAEERELMLQQQAEQKGRR